MDIFPDDIIDSSGVLYDLERLRSSTLVTTSPYAIEVFIEWNNCIATMIYPSQEPEWRKRLDCGSHSQHRWSIYHNEKEIVQIVVKHNSCEKALGFSLYCRNCENKALWRQPCLTPQNVFYILRVNATVDECQQSIDSLIQAKMFLTDSATISSYQHSKPRVAWDHKGVVSPSKRARFDKLEKDIEQMVYVQNMARIEDNLFEFLKLEKDDVENSLQEKLVTEEHTNDVNDDVHTSRNDCLSTLLYDESCESAGQIGEKQKNQHLIVKITDHATSAFQEEFVNVHSKELFEPHTCQRHERKVYSSSVPTWHFADDLAPPGLRFSFESAP